MQLKSAAAATYVHPAKYVNTSPTKIFAGYLFSASNGSDENMNKIHTKVPP